jgi:hypothetical protein
MENPRYSQLTPEERKILEERRLLDERRMKLKKPGKDKRQDQRRRVCTVCGHKMVPGQKELEGAPGTKYAALICEHCGNYKFIETVATRTAKVLSIEPAKKKLIRIGKYNLGVTFPTAMTNALGVYETVDVEIKVEGLNKIGLYFSTGEDIPEEANEKIKKSKHPNEGEKK